MMRLRRPGVVLALTTVALLAVVAGLWSAWLDGDDGDPPAPDGPQATATVTRGSIAATETWDGTLERGTPSTVRSGAPGTITRLAVPGSAVTAGEVLFRVDEQPVVLLTGLVPMYRDLAPGASGVDVEQLEANLALLGYGGFTVDASYTESTASAVRSWQSDTGATPTGRVTRGGVLFVPTGGQVETLRVGVGDVVAPGVPVLDITGTDLVVNVEAELDGLDGFAVGTTVTVDLPDGTEATGEVARVSVVAAGAGGGGMEGAEAEPDQALQVEIALNGGAREELVGASVEVVAAIDERTDVLLVPVNALLARTAGGYGLEVVAGDGSTSLVPVETGLFADGQVEITSGEVSEGTVVGVAGR